MAETKPVQIPPAAHALLTELRARLGRTNGPIIHRALIMLDKATEHERHASTDEWVNAS